MPEFAGLNGAWIEVFRAGDYGDKGRWSAEDLDRVAASYDPKKHPAPVVIGHPAHDAPAWGWVENLKRAGESLWAQLSKVQPEFEDLVKRGMFTQRSVALYKDLNGAGPYLRHLGFLGAMPPEVKGLEPIQLSDGGGFVSIDFQQEEPMDAKELAKTVQAEIRAFFSNVFGEKKPADPTFTETELQERITAAQKPLLDKLEQLGTQFAEAAKKADERAATAAAQANTSRVAAFIERLKGKKVAPAVIAWVEPLATQLVEQAGSVAFVERDKEGKETKKEELSVFDAFCRFVEGNAAIVPTGELAGATAAGAKGKVLAFTETKDLKVDPESEALNARAEQLAAEKRKANPSLTELAAFKEGLAEARAELTSGSRPGGMAAGKV